MAERSMFRRIVLGLPYSRPGHGMHMAAEMARLLQLELFGLFVEEESLFGLASFPFVREFRSIGGGWHAFDIDQLTRDLSIAAKCAERAFASEAKKVPTPARFEVVRGSMIETIASISRAGDIVLLPEPENLDERTRSQFVAIATAAIRSQAAVMLVPDRVARQTGTVVAILGGPEDPCLEVAVNIATAAKEELVVIEAFSPVESTPRYEAFLAPGTKFRRYAVAETPAMIAGQLESILDQDGERLVVMSSRDVAVASRLGSARRVPILVVGWTVGVANSERSRASSN
jgi:hypothetical protein